MDPKWGTCSPIEQNILTILIRNLRNLQYLYLYSTPGDTHCKSRRFHIESPTLEIIDSRGVCSGMAITVDCPKLEWLVCKGGPNGNSCLPNLNRTMFDIALGNLDRNGDFRFSVGRAPLGLLPPNVHTSDSCTILFQRFAEWKEKPDAYNAFRARYAEFENATYQTFEEQDSET